MKASFFYGLFRLLPDSISKTEVVILRRIEKSNATPKFLTENPSTSLSVRIMMMAFITSKNNPRVIIVSGIVKRTNNGFIMELRNAKIQDTINAVIILST